MPIEVRKVVSKRDMKAFIQFPSTRYRDNPYFIPSLQADDAATFDRQKNAAYEFSEADFFLAYKDGKLVGRVAAIINHRANSAWKVKHVRFGWIDFIEDRQVLEALIDTVAAWGKERGMEAIEGPLGFTDFDPEGMLVEGFDRPATMITIYNHEYYPRFFEELGFRKAVDWLEYRIKLPEELDERFEKMAQLIKDKFRLRVRPITRAIIAKEKYGHKVFNLINEAYANLYGYSLLTPRQIDQYVNQYLGFLDLRQASFIEDENGELVAFGITLPSMSEALRKSKGKLFPFGWWHLIKALYLKKPEVCDLLLVAVKPEFQAKGLNAIMFADLIPKLIKFGYKYAESNPELEENLKVRSLWQSFERTQHKRRRIYCKEI